VQAQAAATPKPMQHHKAQEKEQFTSVEDKRRALKKAALIIELRNEWPTIEEVSVQPPLSHGGQGQADFTNTLSTWCDSKSRL
jgi:hypothetical protein